MLGKIVKVSSAEMHVQPFRHDEDLKVGSTGKVNLISLPPSLDMICILTTLRTASW